MLKNTLSFSIIFPICLSSNFTNDFYSKFHQNDYKMDFQRLELVNYSKCAFNFFEIKTFKYNRSLPVANVTFNSKVNMGNKMEVAIQFYKFLSNEYRILPGTNFEVNYCKSFKANIMGMQSMILQHGNFTTCEIVQGKTYVMYNFYPEESLFPPFFPNGEFKLQIDIIYNEDVVAIMAMYIKIYRPIAIPRKHKSVY